MTEQASGSRVKPGITEQANGSRVRPGMTVQKKRPAFAGRLHQSTDSTIGQSYKKLRVPKLEDR
jgi:hypothetical protein